MTDYISWLNDKMHRDYEQYLLHVQAEHKETVVGGDMYSTLYQLFLFFEKDVEIDLPRYLYDHNWQLTCDLCGVDIHVWMNVGQVIKFTEILLAEGYDKETVWDFLLGRDHLLLSESIDDVIEMFKSENVHFFYKNMPSEYWCSFVAGDAPLGLDGLEDELIDIVRLVTHSIEKSLQIEFFFCDKLKIIDPCGFVFDGSNVLFFFNEDGKVCLCALENMHDIHISNQTRNTTYSEAWKTEAKRIVAVGVLLSTL